MRRSHRADALHTISVDGIAAGGEGVGRLTDGRTVFVHRTAPGDVVEVALVEDRPRWARARLVRVLQPSPRRRKAPCPLYDRCGGCSLQHLPESEQRRAKASIVQAALRRIGGLEIEEPDVVAAPLPLRYRNRLSFTLLRLGGGRLVAGFHGIGRPGRVIDVDGRCLLGEEAVVVAWDALRRGWGRGAERLPGGSRLRLTVRAADSGGIDLVVEGGTAPGDPGALLDAVPALRAVWWSLPGRAAVRLAGEVPESAATAAGPPAFSQVNPAVAALLEDHVVAAAAPRPGQRIVEGYCGSGAVARRLAGAGAEVVGIELDAAAVAAARRAPAPRLTVLSGAVEELLPAALPADTVIVDPPRTGLARSVADTLLQAPPRCLVIVSCDPATLARDVRRLRTGFEPAAVTAFDMFPQTAEVETVVTLRRRDA